MRSVDIRVDLSRTKTTPYSTIFLNSVLRNCTILINIGRLDNQPHKSLYDTALQYSHRRVEHDPLSVCFDFGWHHDPRRMDISWNSKGVFGSLKFGFELEVDDQSRHFGAADKYFEHRRCDCSTNSCLLPVGQSGSLRLSLCRLWTFYLLL